MVDEVALDGLRRGLLRGWQWPDGKPSRAIVVHDGQFVPHNRVAKESMSLEIVHPVAVMIGFRMSSK